jgi:hypothetical protein
LADDITPTAAVLELAKLSRELDAAGFRLRDAERAAVNKRHVYSVEFAKALLQSEGPNAEIRKAAALLATQSELISAELAEAELRILKSDIRVLETRLDVGRSVVGVLRAEAAVAR